MNEILNFLNFIILIISYKLIFFTIKVYLINFFFYFKIKFFLCYVKIIHIIIKNNYFSYYKFISFYFMIFFLI